MKNNHRRNYSIREARDGNYNGKARTRVLKFLKELGRDDIYVLDKESNYAVVWTVDCGKVDLTFSFEGALDSYTISVKDSNKEKIESWSGEYGELQMDLEDTVDFIDEFKTSVESTASKAKTESRKTLTKRRIAEARLAAAKKHLQEVYAAANGQVGKSLKELVAEGYPEYVDLVEPYLEEIKTVGEPTSWEEQIPDFLDYVSYILGTEINA